MKLFYKFKKQFVLKIINLYDIDSELFLTITNYFEILNIISNLIDEGMYYTPYKYYIILYYMTILCE